MHLRRSIHPTLTIIWSFAAVLLFMTVLVGVSGHQAADAQNAEPAAEAGQAARVVAVDRARFKVHILDSETNTLESTVSVPNVARVATTPDAATAWTISSELSAPRLTPIDLASGTVGTPIVLNHAPLDIAISPDGNTAYIASAQGQNLTPVNLTTGVVGTPVAVPGEGNSPYRLALTPDGAKAYVVVHDNLHRINLQTNTLEAPISIPEAGLGSRVAVSPDGSTASVTAWTGGVTEGVAIPIVLATGAVGAPTQIGARPSAVTFTADSATTLVLAPGGVTPINVATNTAEPRLEVGGSDIAVTADGVSAYVAGFAAYTIDLATMTLCRPIDDAFDVNTIATTPGSTMRTGCPPAPFADMPLWAADAVEWAYQASHMNGYPTNPPTFQPNNSITRAQVANLIHGVAGRPNPSEGDCEDLSDVPNWAYSAICWLVEQGHASGYPTTPKTFRPNDPITRAQVANMLFSVAGSPPGSPANGFDDVLNWVDPAVDWLTDPGRSPQYATGYNTNPPTFRPDDPITRAQVTRMVCRINAAPGTC